MNLRPILEAVRVLRDEGKLHKKLVTQVRMLLGISLILLLIVTYNVVTRNINPFLVILLGIGGFLFGLFIFSRMNKLTWDEGKEIIQTAKMDMFGFAVLGLYIIFEISLRTVLTHIYPASFTATALLLVTIAGSLIGRSLGTIIAIEKFSKV